MTQPIITQHVNLYTDDFRPKKILLPLEHIIALCLLLIVILGGVTFTLNLAHEDDLMKLTELEEKNSIMVQRIEVMEKEVSLRTLDESLVAANKRLGEKIAARERMMTMLDTLVVEDESQGFSALLIALARQTSESMWLTRISVGQSGRTMSLEGTTLDAEAVPRYLQNLRNESAFVGRTFTLFNLESDDESVGRIHFSLKSELTSTSIASNQTKPSLVSLPMLNSGAAP